MNDSTNSSEEFRETLALTITETVLIGTVSIFGFGCNSFSFLVLIRHKAFKNSFGYLTAYEAFSNACVLLIFILWATPWTFLDIPVELHKLNTLLGQLSLLFVESSFHCCLLITINRFIAVMYPGFYRSMFSERVTPILLLVISLISILYCCVYFIDGCNFYYDHQYGVWTFGTEPCSQMMSFYVDMCYNVFLFVIICCVDVVVFVKLRAATKKMMATSGIQGQSDNKSRHRRETRLFMQSFMVSSSYSFMILCFHLIARNTTGFSLFLCTTFVWGFSHSVGGLILIYFNPEIQRRLVDIRNFGKFLKDPVTVIAVRPTTTAMSASQK
ncbi:hypothetical protein V3C99_012949 [Haemonchus contortus]